jgi:hypothetical protein
MSKKEIIKLSKEELELQQAEITKRLFQDANKFIKTNKMKYFAKYLPVEGEVKKPSGSTVSNEVGKCLRENDNGFDYYQKVALFLCSTNIQIGDMVFDIKTNLQHGICADILITEGKYLYNEHDHYSTKSNSFKVIGEISVDATWVEEGNVFEENEVKFKRDSYTIFSGDYAETFVISEDEYIKQKLDPYKTIRKYIEIKGPCGHFH